MKTYSTIAFLVLLLCLTGCSDSDPSPADESNLDYRLQKIINIDNRVNQNPQFVKSFEYQGDKIDRVYEYNAEGDTTSYTRYFHNQNRLVQTEEFIRKQAGDFEMFTRKELIYENGLLDREILNYPNGSETIEYRFDNLQLSRKLFFDDNDNLTTEEIYTYQDNKLTRVDIKNGNNEQIQYQVHTQPGPDTYKVTYFTPGNDVLRIVTTSFDANGNITFVESDEIAPWSSVADYLQKYVYETW